MFALPISLPDPSLPCYATVAEVVPDALHAAVALGRDSVEAGGAIYKHGPLYCYTTPVTQHSAFAVDYRVGLVSPDKLVALFHTHPGSRATGVIPEVLSDSDVALARRLKVSMYVMAVEARLVVTYTFHK